MIGLIDGNNFFVSCERIFDRALVGKPVAVMSSNDGCVVSRSNEFKALGISMGTPYFQLKPDIARLGLILRSGNHELYADISRRVMQTLAEFAPDIEQYSIDEAYIHPVLDKNADWESFGKEIRKTILKWVGIPCGVGFAPTKTLAKIANHIGKKSPTGVYVMPDDIKSVIEKLPVEEVWGVGRNLSQKLRKNAIYTAWQLANYGDEKLHKMLSIGMVRTAMELRGIPCYEEEDINTLSQSISYSRCYGEPVVEFDDITQSVSYFIARAAEKLRSEGQRASGVNIYSIYYPEYKPYRLDGGMDEVSVSFPVATDDTIDMLNSVKPHLPRLFRKGRRYKKSGVVFWGLGNQAVQLDLFAPKPTATNSKLFEAVDKINAKFGKRALIPLSEGLEKKWLPKRNMASPNYTTDWNDIPVAR